MKNERIRYLELQTKENKGPNVVVIGGGTGQSIFLRGLKHHTENITAIVTVADDGGGSGVLRSDLGMLPPGDIRNCIMALANIEPTMNEVMQYRFEDGALKGQSFGNLFLAAMNGLYGNFETAVYKIGQIFAITGRVLPVTLENIDLIATLENSQVVKGESTIPKEVRKQKCKIDKITLIPEKCRPLDEVISSIHGADIIVMGPGSLYTSVIPNLLVPGVIDAIKKSNQIIATFFAFKVCSESRAFIKEWLTYCSDLELISPAGSLNIPSFMGNNFVVHREDQSLFSLLCKKHGYTPHRDISQRGKKPKSYYNPYYLYSEPQHYSDKYPDILFLHKSPNFGLYTLLKPYLKELYLKIIR